MGSSFKECVAQAVRAYEGEQFLAAAEFFRRAYTLDAQGVLLFNAAQAYRLGGCTFVAYEYYGKFLSACPLSPHRHYAEAWLERLGPQIAPTKAEDFSAIHLQVASSG